MWNLAETITRTIFNQISWRSSNRMSCNLIIIWLCSPFYAGCAEHLHWWWTSRLNLSLPIPSLLCMFWAVVVGACSVKGRDRMKGAQHLSGHDGIGVQLINASSWAYAKVESFHALFPQTWEKYTSFFLPSRIFSCQSLPDVTYSQPTFIFSFLSLALYLLTNNWC